MIFFILPWVLFILSWFSLFYRGFLYFAVVFFILPWVFCILSWSSLFCRKFSFFFAVSILCFVVTLFMLPQLWLYCCGFVFLAVSLFILLWFCLCCRDFVCFAVTVKSHRKFWSVSKNNDRKACICTVFSVEVKVFFMFLSMFRLSAKPRWIR